MGCQQSSPPPSGVSACTKKAWDQKIFNDMIEATGLVLDDSRKEFFRYNSMVLEKITAKQFGHMNRFRQLLLGRKGVGKTALLRALGEAASAAGPIIVVSIDYSAPDQARLPFDEAYDCLPADVKNEYGNLCDEAKASLAIHQFAWLNEALQRCRRTLLFLVDELPLVYGSACTNGKAIISQLHVIGGLDGRAVHCILSGSGKFARKLAFCKLDSTLKGDYPNLSTVDLNSTRYVPRQILPFCGSTEEFKSAVAAASRMVGLESDGWTDSRLVDLFKRSGGCIGSLCILLSNADTLPYTTSGKGLAELPEKKFNFLKSLFLALDIVNDAPRKKSCDTETASADESLLANASNPDPENPSAADLDSQPNMSIDDASNLRSPLDDVFWKLRPIAIDLMKTQGFNDIAMIYDLVDDGFIHYIYNENVSFALPSLLDELDTYFVQKKGITLTELVNLKNHYKDGYVCEPTVLRLLAQSSNIFGVSLNYESDRAIPDDLPDVKLADEEVVNRIFAELCDGKDQFGGDGAFLVPCGSDTFTLHRIQIKLGLRALKLEDAQAIASKMKKSGLEEKYRQKGFVIKKQEHYLVTTRGIHKDAREHLIKESVKVIDARELREHVWPNSVKALGGVFDK